MQCQPLLNYLSYFSCDRSANQQRNHVEVDFKDVLPIVIKTGEPVSKKRKKYVYLQALYISKSQSLKQYIHFFSDIFMIEVWSVCALLFFSLSYILSLSRERVCVERDRDRVSPK